MPNADEKELTLLTVSPSLPCKQQNARVPCLSRFIVRLPGLFSHPTG